MPTSPSDATRELYVISCRKPMDNYKEITAWRINKREASLHVPKRAGTFTLLQAPLGEDDLQEEDLVQVQGEDGLPLDTDTIERIARRPDLLIDGGGAQREIEDRIAALLWRRDLPLVLFVHGYNVTPGDALRAGQTIQRHFDRTRFAAQVVVFRWPSNGHLLDYFPDQESAGRFGSYAFVNLLLSLRRAAGGRGRTLHCLAHSMGTYVTTRALGTISILGLDRLLDPGTPRALEQVVFMQPDIDFDCLCSGYQSRAWDSPSYLEIPDGYAATKLVERLTIYCSTNDVALFASLFTNRTKRLGAYGPGLELSIDRAELMSTKVRQNVVVVNCDDYYLFDPDSGHSHSHFLHCPPIMGDVTGALRGDAPRANAARSETPAGSRWYTLTYRSPGPLPAMAGFWKAVGSFAINRVIMAVVKVKKWLQLATRILGTLAPVVPIVVSLVMGTIWRDHPGGFGVLVVSLALVVLYAILWVFGWSVLRHEDG